jgi:hypothetical protein
MIKTKCTPVLNPLFVDHSAVSCAQFSGFQDIMKGWLQNQEMTSLSPLYLLKLEDAGLQYISRQNFPRARVLGLSLPNFQSLMLDGGERISVPFQNHNLHNAEMLSSYFKEDSSVP